PMLARMMNVAGLVVLLGLPTSGLVVPPGTPAVVRPARPREPVDLESFIDRIVEEHRARHGTPGVAVCVVKEGRIVLAKGYGYADLESRRLVDPGKTIFPVFSVTKPFTATALMRLVEQGRVDLREDVRRYVPDLPRFEGWPGPLTLHQIFTHTTGFDKSFIGLVAPPGQDPLTPERFSKVHRLTRIDPPDRYFEYSIGYTYTVAGHILERVTGLPYAHAMRQLVLEPLQMSRSECRILRSQEPDLAWGYVPDATTGRWVRTGRVRTQVEPAAVLHTTAEDMGAFLIAHLEGGVHKGRRILRAQTVETMHARQFSPHPAFPGVGYGFIRGPGIVEHAGGPLPHLSCIVLAPGHRTGLFFATNAISGLYLLKELKHRFLRQYLPETTAWALPERADRPDPDVACYAGLYRLRFYPRRDLGKIEALTPIWLEMKVSVAGPGRLVATHTFLPIRIEARRVTGDLFDRSDGQGPLAFSRDAGGAVTGFVTHPVLPALYFPFAFERIPWYGSRDVGLALLVLFVIGFGWLCGVGPLLRLSRRRVTTRESAGRLPAPYRLLRFLTAAANMLLLFAPVLAVFPLEGFLPRLVCGLPPSVQFILRVSPGILVLDVVTFLLALRLLRRREVRLGARLAFLAVGLLSLLFVWFASSWNLAAL
ncbi:MAG: beta-lactamase family protein, partial [Candidatus Riflebacteria bacterium]|nr:beta-lactamase family protein [Candidatus Riflebacteria bacterium]